MEGERRVIMLIDDDETSLSFGREILEDKYTVYPVQSGEQAFTILKKIIPDLILLDIEMPGLDGYAVIKLLKQNPETENIPVIFLTSYSDPGNELDGLSLGAIDYITKPFSPLLLVQRIDNHLLYSQKKELSLNNINLKKMADARKEEIAKFQNAILSLLPGIVEYRDRMSGGHIERTLKYIRVMIDEMIKQGLYKNEIESLDLEIFINASQMHDIGNIYIDESIINKPGKLTVEEFDMVKKHPASGLKVLNLIRQLTGEYSFLTYAGLFAENHHERWDGSGYPAGRRGHDIPLAGRLMALADVYDALVSTRPYKQPVEPSKASQVIIDGSGTSFDPDLVEIFKTVSNNFAQISSYREALM